MFCLLWLIAFGFLLYFIPVELRAKRKACWSYPTGLSCGGID
jgi:hypothetical protein